MRVLVLLVSAVVAVAACDPALAKLKPKPSPDYYDIKDAPASENDDPWQGFNQPIFNFNVFFDRHVFKPVITVYDTVPGGVRRSIHNGLVNLSEPLNAAHGLLQLNPNIFFTSVWRFILNSTFGLGGIDDFAGRNANLRNLDQDLGKTMGRWGVPSGPYVVLPILGPSSVRDTTGRVGDWFADPIGWAETPWAAAGHAAANGIDTRSTQADVIERLYYESIDPYASTRSAYRQHERFEETSNSFAKPPAMPGD